MKKAIAPSHRKVRSTRGKPLKITYGEIAPVSLAFGNWLLRTGGKHALYVFRALEIAEIAEREYRSVPAALLVNMLNANQRKFLRNTRRRLRVAESWLAKQEKKHSIVMSQTRTTAHLTKKG